MQSNLLAISAVFFTVNAGLPGHFCSNLTPTIASGGSLASHLKKRKLINKNSFNKIEVALFIYDLLWLCIRICEVLSNQALLSL